MAIYRLSSKGISRSKGQSSLASAAYRSAEILTDERLEKTFNYQNRQSVYHTEILLPTNAPEAFKDRQTLWNSVEKSETRINSEVAKEYQLALPTELNHDDKIKLVKTFADNHFMSQGLGVDLAFHDFDKHNPHVHLMVTTRAITANGMGDKNREIKDRNFLIELRKNWEFDVNKSLEAIGIDQRVSSDSYKTQGLDIKGVSVNGYGDNAQGQLLDQQTENSLKLLDNPGQIADALTANNAVFGERELGKFISRHILESHQEEAVERLYLDPNFIEVANGRYTSANYLQKEKSLVCNLSDLNQSYSKTIDWDYAVTSMQKHTLNDSQQHALTYALDDDKNIKNIIGLAGTGKSHTLKAITDVYDQAGYNIKGVALSGIVADNLAKDASIEDSRTLHSFLASYERGQQEINSKTLIVLDEASLVGTRQFEQLAGLANENGAKLICVGDNQQLQAIDAGGAFRLVVDQTGYVALDEVQRQHKEADRLATYQLATGDINSALTHYRDQGSIEVYQDKKILADTMVERYTDARQADKTQIILAHKRQTVKGFNKAIHEQLKTDGKLGESNTINGVEYSEKDRFIFLKNDYGLNVRNGTTGNIEKIQDQEMQIRCDDGRKININTQDYDQFSHGYAVTIHKSQGVTVDQTQLYLDKNTNANLAYVGMTRHKENLHVSYLTQSETNPAGIKNFEQLVKLAERQGCKELVKDYDLTLDNRQKTTSPTLDKLEEIKVETQQQQEIEAIKHTLTELKTDGKGLANELVEAYHERRAEKQIQQQEKTMDRGFSL
jgi:Ti-type conjugative transfer relaxase TraA